MDTEWEESEFIAFLIERKKLLAIEIDTLKQTIDYIYNLKRDDEAVYLAQTFRNNLLIEYYNICDYLNDLPIDNG